MRARAARQWPLAVETRAAARSLERTRRRGAYQIRKHKRMLIGS